MKSKFSISDVLMRGALPVLAFTMLSGCASHQQSQGERSRGPEAMALGWVDHRAVLDQPQFSQFRTTYDTTQVDQQIVGLIRHICGSTDWIVFFGSWCGDSRQHVPRFLKIADAAGIPKERVRLYGLDRSKKSSDGFAEEYHIRLVPTFVCLKQGKEVGRITETPTISIEADMLNMLASAP